MVSFNFNTTTAQLASVARGASNLLSGTQYNPFGHLKGFTYGNGLSLAQNTDLDGRLISNLVNDGVVTPLVNLSYHYDNYNQIKEITNNSDSTKTQTFIYDDLHRLQQAIGYYGQYNYDYDPVGNRLTRTRNLSGTTVYEDYHYASDSNRLQDITHTQDSESVQQVLGYDDAGSPTSEQRPNGQTLNMQYDENNRLININVTQ